MKTTTHSTDKLYLGGQVKDMNFFLQKILGTILHTKNIYASCVKFECEYFCTSLFQMNKSAENSRFRYLLRLLAMLICLINMLISPAVITRRVSTPTGSSASSCWCQFLALKQLIMNLVTNYINKPDCTQQGGSGTIDTFTAPGIHAKMSFLRLYLWSLLYTTKT